MPHAMVKDWFKQQIVAIQYKDLTDEQTELLFDLIDKHKNEEWVIEIFKELEIK
jgi:hypothetical protein